MSLMIDGCMPSVGSSRMISLRLRQQRAGDRQLLLLAAGQVAAAPSQHFFQHREQFVHFALDAALPCAPDLRRHAHQQVFLHRQPGENLAALRHVARCPARRAGAASGG